jgi:hypothetical protein
MGVSTCTDREPPIGSAQRMSHNAAHEHDITSLDRPSRRFPRAALALPVTYVAFVPKDASAAERAKTDKSWQRAVARGWTIRTFPGHHVAQQEDPR